MCLEEDPAAWWWSPPRLLHCIKRCGHCNDDDAVSCGDGGGGASGRDGRKHEKGVILPLLFVTGVVGGGGDVVGSYIYP